MLMTAVIVGTSLQIQKDGILSPHSLFLFTVLGSWFIAAFLHPLVPKKIQSSSHFSNNRSSVACCRVPYTFWQFLACLCSFQIADSHRSGTGYCQSIHCAIWTLSLGEPGRMWQPIKTPRTPQHMCIKQKMVKDQGMRKKWINFEGEVSVGCGNFCRVVCCVRNSEPVQVRRFDEGLRQIERKLESLERKTNGKGQRNKVAATNQKEAHPGQTNFMETRQMDLTGWMEAEPFCRFCAKFA